MYTYQRHESFKGQNNNCKGSLSTMRLFNVRADRMYFSKRLCEEMGIKHGTHIAFSQDEFKPELCYIRVADDPDDNYETQSFLVGWARKDKRSLRGCCVVAARNVLNLVGAKKSCSVFVSPTPTTDEHGKKHYRLILEAPRFVK